MKRFWMISVSALVFTFVGFGTARAGGIVFDPVNYVQNYATAISNVEQYSQQVDQYVTQLQQLRYQVHSLQNLNPAAIGNILQTDHLNKEYAEYQKLQGSLYKTYGSLSTVQRTLNDTNNLLSGRGLNPFSQNISWKQYENALVDIGHQQGKAASQSMTNTYKQIKSASGNIAQLKAITHQIQKNGQSASMKAEMTTMNSSLTLIARQNQQMLGAMLPLILLKENQLRQKADQQQRATGYSYKKLKAQQKAGLRAMNASGGYFACEGANHFSYTKSQLNELAKEDIYPNKCPSGPVQSPSKSSSSNGGGR